MRILIFPMGSAGDVHPFLGVGRALKNRGHEVFIITSGWFEQATKDAGLEFVELGTAEDFKKITDDPDLWNPNKALSTIINKGVNHSYEPMLEIVEKLHKPGDTVLVASSLAFGARNARDKFDVPLVSAHLAPSIFMSSHRPPRIHGAPMPPSAPRLLHALQWWVGGKIIDKLILPKLNEIRRKHGLKPARDVIRTWWHSPDRVIGLFPEWYGPRQPDWPSQTSLTGFPLFDEKTARPMPDKLKAFLDAGTPPVVFTPGSAMSHGQDFFHEAVKALKLVGRRGVLQSAYPETIPADLPEDVIHVDYAPFSELFARSAALVFHGGVGTCAQALRAGIPVFIQHMAHDQLDNLSRVRDLGVGEGVAPKEFKAERVARALYGLLSDGQVRAQCDRVSRLFHSERWMDETCRLIETTNKKPRD